MKVFICQIERRWNYFKLLSARVTIYASLIKELIPGCLFSNISSSSAHTFFCVRAPSSLLTNGDSAELRKELY